MQYLILDVQTIKTRYGHRFKQFQCIYILERSKTYSLLNNFVWSFGWCRKWCYAWKRKERKSKKMVIDAPALASLVGGRAQKVMESESKRPKICKKQDNQIPRERKCKSKKDKANNSLFGRGRGKTQLPNQLLSCNKNCLLTAWISGSLSLNLFLVLTPKSFTGACSSSLNCFTIAQWKKSLFWYSRRVDYEI